MNLNYRFKRLKLTDGIFVNEPIIPVTLLGSNDIRLNVTAILDTGSDFILLPLELAEELGLKFDKAKEDSAKFYSGESITTTQSKVRIKIERGHEKVIVECKCAILLDREKQHEHVIFGSTFLEHFRAIFDYPVGRFQLKQ